MLAGDLGVHRHTIHRAIRTIRGISFRKLQQEMLLERALHFLTERSELSVKQIAISLGYGSPQSFARFIRARTGASATETRQKKTGRVRIQSPSTVRMPG